MRTYHYPRQAMQFPGAEAIGAMVNLKLKPSFADQWDPDSVPALSNVFLSPRVKGRAAKNENLPI